jgi:O-antigen/teichoic acid export membrane protein
MSEAAKPAGLGFTTLLGVLSQFIALLVGFWSTPQLLHGLGEAAYGALAIVVSFTTYFFYLELGLGGAYIRELSGALAKNDLERAQKLFETAHSIYLRIGAISASLMLVLGIPYLYRATTDESLLYQVLGCIAATALMLFVSMALSASRGIVFAMQRADLFYRASVFFQPVVLLLQVIAVWAGFGILGVLGIQLVGNFSLELILRNHSLRLMPSIIHRAQLHPEIWRELKNFSLYRFASQMAQQGQWTGDRVLLGFLLSTDKISSYAISGSVAQRLRIFALTLNGPFFAAASERFAANGAEGLSEICGTFLRRSAVFLALSSAGATFLASPFLLAWVGPSYAKEGSPILQVMVLSTSLLAVSGLIGLSTDAAGVPRASAVGSVLGVSVSLMLSVFLVLLFGPLGAAIGFAVGALVQFSFLLVSFGFVIGSQRVLLLFRRSVLSPFFIGLFAYAAMRIFPPRKELLASLGISVFGAIMGGTVAGLSGVLKREDLPNKLRRFWIFPW